MDTLTRNLPKLALIIIALVFVGCAEPGASTLAVGPELAEAGAADLLLLPGRGDAAPATVVALAENGAVLGTAWSSAEGLAVELPSGSAFVRTEDGALNVALAGPVPDGAGLVRYRADERRFALALAGAFGSRSPRPSGPSPR
jgi:hypothetical protein